MVKIGGLSTFLLWCGGVLKLRFQLGNFFLHKHMESFFRVIVWNNFGEQIFEIWVLLLLDVIFYKLTQIGGVLFLLLKPLLDDFLSLGGILILIGGGILLLFFKKLDNQIYFLLILLVYGSLHFSGVVFVKAIHLGYLNWIDARIFDVLVWLFYKIIVLAVGT